MSPRSFTKPVNYPIRIRATFEALVADPHNVYIGFCIQGPQGYAFPPEVRAK